jgi:hypothetical protein
MGEDFERSRQSLANLDLSESPSLNCETVHPNPRSYGDQIALQTTNVCRAVSALEDVRLHRQLLWATSNEYPSGSNMSAA